jgi:hypothetical protein
MSGSGEIIFWLVVLFICCLCLGSKKDREEKRKYKYDPELSSYIDLVAAIYALAISFEDTENAYETEQLLLELVMKRAQLEVKWHRENGGLHNKNLSLNHLDYDKKIEEAFVNCDEWGWLDRKEEDIEQH